MLRPGRADTREDWALETLLAIRLTANSTNIPNLSAPDWRTSISGICSWLTTWMIATGSSVQRDALPVLAAR